MKKFSQFIFLLIAVLGVNQTKTQKFSQTDSVGTLILKNGPRLDSIFKDCELHYAMMKMEINKDNQIVSLSALNKISEDFYNIFSPIKKMVFPEYKNKVSRTVVFVYIVNPRRKCYSGEVNHRSNLNYWLPELTHLLVNQMIANPKTFYYGIIETYPEIQ